MAARKLILTAALAAVTAAALPAAASAHDRGHGHKRHHHHHHERSHYDGGRTYYRDGYAQPRYYREAPRNCRSGGTTGLIIGGAAGALLGRELDGGRDRTTGTVLGAGAGALLGREIAKTDRC